MPLPLCHWSMMAALALAPTPPLTQDAIQAKNYFRSGSVLPDIERLARIRDSKEPSPCHAAG